MRKITLNVLKSVLAEVFVTGSLGGGTLTGRGTLLLPASHGADGVRTLLIQSLSLHCNPGPYAAEGVEAFFFFFFLFKPLTALDSCGRKWAKAAWQTERGWFAIRRSGAEAASGGR